MRFPVRFLVRVAPTERRVGVGLLPGIHTTIFVVSELKRHVLLLEKIVDDLPVRLAVGVWGFGIHPLVDFPVREFEKRLEIRPGSRCQFVDEAVGGSRIVTDFGVAEPAVQHGQYRSYDGHSNFPCHKGSVY